MNHQSGYSRQRKGIAGITRRCKDYRNPERSERETSQEDGGN